MIKRLIFAGLIFFIVGCNNITMDFPDPHSSDNGQQVNITADLQLSPDVIVIPRDSVIKYFLKHSLPNTFQFKPEILNSFPIKVGTLILSEFDYFKLEYVENVIIQPNEVVLDVKRVSLLDLIDNFELAYAIPMQFLNDSLIKQLPGDSLIFNIYKSPLAIFYKRFEPDYSIKFNSNPETKFSGHIIIRNHQLKLIRCESIVSEDAGLFFQNKNSVDNSSLNFPMVHIPVQLTFVHQNVKVPLDITLSNEIGAYGLKSGHFSVESSLQSDYTTSLNWTPESKDDIKFDGDINFTPVSFDQERVFGTLEYRVNLDIQLNKIPFLTHTYVWKLKTFDTDKYDHYVKIYSTNLMNAAEDDVYPLVSMEKE